MKEKLASLLRHALSGLSGLGALAAKHSIIDSTDSLPVDAAGKQLGDALAVIIGALVMRGLMWLAANKFPALKSLLGNPRGNGLAMIALSAGAIVAGSTLTSCRALQDFQFTGRAVHRFSDGSKAGIECQDGRCGVFGQIAQPDGFAEVRVDHESTK